MSDYPPSFKHGMLRWEYPDPLDEDGDDICALRLDPDHHMTMKNLQQLTDLQARVLTAHLDIVVHMIALSRVPNTNGS